jgi:hypothetical protein
MRAFSVFPSLDGLSMRAGAFRIPELCVCGGRECVQHRLRGLGRGTPQGPQLGGGGRGSARGMRYVCVRARVHARACVRVCSLARVCVRARVRSCVHARVGYNQYMQSIQSRYKQYNQYNQNRYNADQQLQAMLAVCMRLHTACMPRPCARARERVVSALPPPPLGSTT